MSGPAGRRKSRGDRLLSGIGLALAALMAVAGLTVVGLFVVFIVGMSRYGSNK